MPLPRACGEPPRPGLSPAERRGAAEEPAAPRLALRGLSKARRAAPTARDIPGPVALPLPSPTRAEVGPRAGPRRGGPGGPRRGGPGDSSGGVGAGTGGGEVDPPRVRAHPPPLRATRPAAVDPPSRGTPVRDPRVRRFSYRRTAGVNHRRLFQSFHQAPRKALLLSNTKTVGRGFG